VLRSIEIEILGTPIVLKQMERFLAARGEGGPVNLHSRIE
jgi:hypothetical protein